MKISIVIYINNMTVIIVITPVKSLSERAIINIIKFAIIAINKSGIINLYMSFISSMTIRFNLSIGFHLTISRFL